LFFFQNKESRLKKRNYREKEGKTETNKDMQKERNKNKKLSTLFHLQKAYSSDMQPAIRDAGVAGE
jgi:hypothetical protein